MRKEDNRLKKRQKRLRWRRNRVRRQVVVSRGWSITATEIPQAGLPISAEGYLSFHKGMTRREARILIQDNLRKRLGYGS